MVGKSPEIRLPAGMSSAIGIVAANFITIILAIAQNWNPAILIWGFWAQSLIIGVFSFVRILSLRQFSTRNFKINNRPVEPTAETKITTAIFFLFHYGFFHAVYAFMIPKALSVSLSSGDLRNVLIIALLFFVASVSDFRRDRTADRRRIPNIGKMMFLPYVRILPMHTMMIFGSKFGENQLLLFLILKMGADVAMHLLEGRIYERMEKVVGAAGAGGNEIDW